MAISRLSQKSLTHLLEKLSKQEKLTIAFLPIKPRFADKILSGEKKFEYRKKNISIPISYVVIYSSSPTKKIIGFAELDGISRLTPSSAWRSTRHSSGIAKSDFDKYFDGHPYAYVLEFKKVYRLAQPLKPADIIRGFKVPQSFRYVNKDFLLSIVNRGLLPSDKC